MILSEKSSSFFTPISFFYMRFIMFQQLSPQNELSDPKRRTSRRLSLLGKCAIHSLLFKRV